MTLGRKTLLALAAFFLLANLRQRAVQHPFVGPLDVPAHDVFSFSDPSQVAVRHVALDLTVDFEAKQLRGSATLLLDNHNAAHTLVLDTSELAIGAVTIDGAPALWSLGTTTPNGTPLTIGIEPSTHYVRIDYATSPTASALQWNSAEQSFGRVRPYLYSINEPVGARSWIPIQDTPATRMTYEATLHVPPDLLALMSAENNPASLHGDGVYHFTMSRTVPAYLIALAVGRLEFRAIGARSGVYAEPELIDDAQRELAYLPDMIDAAERICGPFPFVRHDIALMPPTFVAGGMEHPMLNFLNPFSTVTQNRDTAVEPKALVAHELAHSWAGDATTLSTWSDVWLNEGITSYLTLRILEEMGDGDRAELAYANDRAGYAAFAKPNDPDTILHRTDPPSAGAMFSNTSYTKGELFLRMLEDELGRDALDAFLQRYFRKLSFHWTDDRNFLALLLEAHPDAREALRLDEWIYAPGLPSNVTAPASSAMRDTAIDRGNRWASGTPLAELGASSWTPTELELFLLYAPGNTVRARMTELDAAFGLSAMTAPPNIWLTHAMLASYTAAWPAIERVLMRGGPNSTIVATYTKLAHADLVRARTIFEHARNRYLASVAAQVQSILGVPSAGLAHDKRHLTAPRPRSTFAACPTSCRSAIARTRSPASRRSATSSSASR